MEKRRKQKGKTGGEKERRKEQRAEEKDPTSERSQLIQVKVQNTQTVPNVPLRSSLSGPLTSDLRGVVCSPGGSRISTQDGPTERAQSRTVGKAVMQRSDRQGRRSSINPDVRACPGQRTGREPSGSFSCKARLRKHQHRNHKGEDEAVFLEEKQRFLPKAEVRALLIYFSNDEEKILLPSDLGLFLAYVPQPQRPTRLAISFPQPENFQELPTA